MLDYAPLTITIPIVKKNVNSIKYSIIKDSEEEASSIKNVTTSIRNLNTSNLLDIISLDRAINEFANAVKNAWKKNLKTINITKHSKSWWDKNYSRDLENYRLLKSLEDWKTFCKTVRNMKCLFFNLKIQEITNKKCSPWKLINWVNK